MDGLIWYSTPAATVGLVVKDGVVVDAPPYARKWALGRSAEELLNHSHATTAWLPAARSTMTDMSADVPADDVDWSDVEGAADAAYPEYPANPHNHLYTVSISNGAPMIVVRGNTAAEIKARFEALEEEGVAAVMANVQTAMKAAFNLAQGLGATPVPPAPQAPSAGAQVAAAYPTPAAVPPLPAPGQPYQGQPAWQTAGAPAPAPAVQVPPGWYKLNVPFKQKPQFDAIVAQYGLRKGDPNNGGQVSFQKGNKTWYCAPDVAGAFAAFSPVAA